MDDLIVIILTLIIAVVGALGQIKKKKAPQPAPEAETGQEDLWDFFEEEVEERPNPVDETEVTPSVKELPKEPVFQFKPEVEGNSDFNKPQKNTLIVNDQNIKKVKKSFSLRKAVIYSEILNRKYT